jgi:murein DD-endopeptidase MepM/ murein hydrolase activator NlpD
MKKSPPIVDEQPPIVVDFPLRGEWVAYHTPAERVPSHGTDLFGQRYAFDFLRIDRDKPGWKMCPTSLRHYLTGVPLEACYGWGQPIHAPFAGVVVAAADGWRERRRVHFVSDFAVVLKNGLTFNPKRPQAAQMVAGNYVILQMPGTDVHAFLAHARTGSIRVRAGEEVAAGAHIADVGHSGNSTGPHLHFQLMDGPDPLTAAGVPCAFRGYEALRDGEWISVVEGIPAKREFIRRVA